MNETIWSNFYKWISKEKFYMQYKIVVLDQLFLELIALKVNTIIGYKIDCVLYLTTIKNLRQLEHFSGNYELLFEN